MDRNRWYLSKREGQKHLHGESLSSGSSWERPWDEVQRHRFFVSFTYPSPSAALDFSHIDRSSPTIPHRTTANVGGELYLYLRLFTCAVCKCLSLSCQLSSK